MQKIINQVQFADFLLNGFAGKGAQPVSFLAFVQPKFRKTGNPFSDIRKLSTVNAFTGADYEKSVNRQLDREGKTQLEFHAAERQWGERISPTLVQNNGKLYLVAQIQKTGEPVYFARSGNGFFQSIAKAAIEQFLPPVRHAENQGTDKEIVYRNYALENIVAFRGLGEDLVIQFDGFDSRFAVIG